MPLFIADYLADTGDLSTEEHGAYLLLMMAAWRMGGKVPSDPERMARLAKLSLDRWLTVWLTLARFFFDSGDGFMVQRRLRDELVKAEARKVAATANGRKGGASKRTVSETEANHLANLETEYEAERQANGLAESSSSSSPSGISLRGSDPDQTRSNDEATWSEFVWCRRFGNRWAEAKKRQSYGHGGDTKSIATLGDILRSLPDRAACQANATAIFDAYLRDTNPILVREGHPFAFFVSRFNGILAAVLAAPVKQPRNPPLPDLPPFTPRPKQGPDGPHVG